MYFTKVELHNYGIYQGTHEMSLVNKIGTKNITLVGGLNGRGKTTFHNAILLALYGKQALKYIQENARSYEKLLADSINRHATDDKTYVAVSLVLDDDMQLRVRREWSLKGKQVIQRITVEKNGIVDKYLGESWSYYIEEILPFGIAKFFFFNNEKIMQLADDSSFEQMKASIKSAIGVSAIESAIYHTNEVIRRKEHDLKSFETSDLRQEYQDIESQINALDQKIDTLTAELRQLDVQCQTIAAELEARETEFWSSGGDLLRNREAIREEMKKIEAATDQIQQSILQTASDPATPLALCSDLVVQSFNAEKSQQQNEARLYTEEIILELRQRVLDKLRQAGLKPETYTVVSRIINDELMTDSSPADHSQKTRMSPATMMLFERLISDVFPSLSQKIDYLIETAQAQESQYMSLDAHLGAADEKTMAIQLLDLLKGLEGQKAVADTEYQKHQELFESLTHQREQLNNRRTQLIKNVAEQEQDNDDNGRIVRYAALSLEVLTEFKKRLQREKTALLSSTATACFQRLVEKNSLVKSIDIDPDTLDVTIMDRENRELLKSQLSAGEQQMFAVSVIWAIALTSGYKAPVIIDTPMARLDSSHRTNFVTKYLPAASSQVIVLSTDEEISGRYLDMVRDHVVDSYTLLYREEEQCTSIVHGYFKET